MPASKPRYQVAGSRLDRAGSALKILEVRTEVEIIDDRGNKRNSRRQIERVCDRPVQLVLVKDRIEVVIKRVPHADCQVAEGVHIVNVALYSLYLVLPMPKAIQLPRVIVSFSVGMNETFTCAQ